MNDVFGNRPQVDMPSQQLPAILPGQQGDTSINIVNGIVTAQRVAITRDIRAVMNSLKALCASFGDQFVYSWEVNDRKNNRKTVIKGPTIKLANAMARQYGNCMVQTRVVDGGNHWMFMSRFIDLETGFSLERGYQQRKGQQTGMKDEQRALDMVFQIGQSKAVRNVIVNALQELTTFCVEEAEKGVLSRVASSPDAARKWIIDHLAEMGVDTKRVSAIYGGRDPANWTVPNMAKIYQEIRSIEDGMAGAEDVYPPLDADGKTVDDDPTAGIGKAIGGGEQQMKVARSVVNSDGVALFPTDEDYELGATIMHDGVKLRVVEVSETAVLVETVVEKLAAEPANKKPPRAAATKKEKDPPATTTTAAPAAAQTTAAKDGDNLDDMFKE